LIIVYLYAIFDDDVYVYFDIELTQLAYMSIVASVMKVHVGCPSRSDIVDALIT